MQKKVVLALLMAALLAGGAFAEGFLSAGAGTLFDFNVNNGVKYNGEYTGVRILTLGFYGFFDFTYGEADVSFAYGKSIGEGDLPGINGRLWQLGFTLLGKYPFELGDFTIFPLVGFDYNVIFSRIVAGTRDTEPGKWNQFGILAGVGSDFDLTDSLYLRGEAMFHLRFPSTFMKEADGSPTLGMGPRIKFGLGYRF